VLRLGTNARSATLVPQASPAKNGPRSAVQHTQNVENARSTGELNLRVSYLGGGDKRVKRSTGAAGGLGTEWAWKCSPKHAKDREFEEYQRSTGVLNLRVA
jgi:hypothetical protein